MKFPSLRDETASNLEISVLNQSDLDLPLSKDAIQKIALHVLSEENIEDGFVELIYSNPDEMIRLNSEFLKETYLTDNIAFRYEEEGDPMEATIIQCPFRIQEQATDLGILFKHEFCRVLIHGLLHICGHEDQTEEQIRRIRQTEDRYLDALGIS